MPYETIRNHRHTGNATKDMLVRWSEPEASILSELGIPTEYYGDANAHGGLANYPCWMVSMDLQNGRADVIKRMAEKYTLETPETK